MIVVFDDETASNRGSGTASPAPGQSPTKDKSPSATVRNFPSIFYLNAYSGCFEISCLPLGRFTLKSDFALGQLWPVLKTYYNRKL
jgi:hypothetical protein